MGRVRGIGHIIGLLFCCLATWIGVSRADSPQVGVVRLHVSPTGNDEHDGGDDKPLRTLDEARDRVRELLASDSQRLVEVILHDGVYRIESPLVLGTQDGATGWGSVTWKNAEGQRPVISGARAIPGWRDAGDGAWEASIAGWPGGGFRELFVNGERRPRARHPNDGYLHIEKAGSDRRSYFYYEPGAVDQATLESGQELVFFHDWTITRLPVEAIDRERRVITPIAPIGNTLPMFHIDNWEPHPRYYLENDPGFMDAPGEWWLDEARGVARYRPMAGESINTARFEAPVARRLIDVRGESGKPVSGIHFRGLHFSHCAWEQPAMGYFGIQATAFEPDRGGLPPGWVLAAIHVELAENVTFEGGSIAHTGTGGIWLGSRTRDCAVRGMHVHDIAGNGIALGEGAGGRWIDGVAWEVAVPNEVATGNRVEDCLIERVGQVYHGAVGVWAGLTARTVIAHNTIRDTPYSGISMGWKWSTEPTPARENRVAHNHIHGVMRVLSDGGAIYTLGRQPGSVILGNLIHDVPENSGRADSNGMFFDEGTMHVRVEGNTIYDIGRSPLRWHRAGTNVVTGNVLVHRPGVALFRMTRTAEDAVTWGENTVVEAERWTPENDASLRVGPREPYRERFPL